MNLEEDFERVATLDEILPGNLRGIEVDGFDLVLGNVEGEIYAVGGVCSHEGSELRMGRLEGTKLTCFAHQWSYDIRTGVPIWPPISRVAPGYRLRIYPVRIEGNEVFVSKKPGRRGLQ